MATYLTRKPDNKYARYAWIVEQIADEMMDELADSGPEEAEKLGEWFADFGRVFTWCGNGDASILPESVRDFLTAQYPQEVLAIEAPEASLERV